VTHDLAILQAARLKSRLTPEAAAASVGTDPDTAAGSLAALQDAGFLKGENAVRLTPEGRARLLELVAEERTATDQAALTVLYAEFDKHNSELKQIIHDWQLRGGHPNNHADADYDRSVIDRLMALDVAFGPLRGRISGVVPRLAQFPIRFDGALEQIRRGDMSYVARPVIDSYHTVWFEYHEELLGVLGLQRVEEAAAGRAG
jgi:pyruvate,orthophosphate dikinase